MSATRSPARLWRRSLQFRVVVGTLVLSAIVIGLTGWALVRSVADGLAEGRRDVAVSEARAGFEAAQAQLDAAVETQDGAQSQTLAEMVDDLSTTGSETRPYDLVLEGPLVSGAGVAAPVRSSVAFDESTVPASLRASVRDDGGVFWSYSRARPLGTDESAPAVVVGGRLDVPSTGDAYALYYVFSMAEQQSTLDLVLRALLLGGMAMVLLVAGVAWIVSRQVVNPVRLARRIAERYAAGNLEQRMHVRGEDDIARLSTSFNQMAASLQSQIRRLENLSRLQQRFVSDVSHELRTPLTTVRMAGEVLHRSRDRFDPATARAAELLTAEIERFEELLSDLLDLSRFDAGAAQLELDAVDLSQVARDVVQDPVVRVAGLPVELEGADVPVVVDADIRRVDRIMRNLVANAVKYSRTDRLLVRVAENEGCASIAVRDFGIGLRGDETQRVFDRFWRADPARTQGGTGLGLPISREDAALHGGTLRVWSRPAEGTEFVLTLPRAGGSVHPPAIVSELA
ncbi:MtrAB system histidine kinase MtrB [Aeromicrobium sp. IC_218]|uniref:MtrAB system histidine kinase MtrB n=1 Tax=Aeromicrobium sp. IC_218 TaxID=2545468 RepID=UPI0010405BC5|nr:MtrAB system histidine kinase MtrB [Aeromicrobium sp. IC_218]TCI95689.1 HAMP domain-containing histidine kinase [Aeromicrobium sp. IC_218]